jgi:cysteine desulfurase
MAIEQSDLSPSIGDPSHGKFMAQLPIYLDCHATTPVDPRVLSAMIPYFTEHFGNASSITHVYGWTAEAAVTKARETLARGINATPEEIVFTSGATEANNLAIKGVAEAYLLRVDILSLYRQNIAPF